jgi:hypothetical protein
MQFDFIPEGLRKPEAPVDHVAAARKAEALVLEIRSAVERGLIDRGRTNRALAAINADLMEVGMTLNRCANNPRLLVLERRRHGLGVKSIHGSLNEVSEFSRLQNSYLVLYESMCEIQILTEGLMQ